jgi:hypothetical protein
LPTEKAQELTVELGTSVPASENSQLQRLVGFLEGAERLTGMPTLLTVRDKLLSLSFALREKERQSSACRKD